eukprot:Polyplicarium_translucidae@DN3283_c0_g1_i9.p1
MEEKTSHIRKGHISVVPALCFLAAQACLPSTHSDMTTSSAPDYLDVTGNADDVHTKVGVTLRPVTGKKAFSAGARDLTRSGSVDRATKRRGSVRTLSQDPFLTRIGATGRASKVATPDGVTSGDAPPKPETDPTPMSTAKAEEEPNEPLSIVMSTMFALKPERDTWRREPSVQSTEATTEVRDPEEYRDPSSLFVNNAGTRPDVSRMKLTEEMCKIGGEEGKRIDRYFAQRLSEGRWGKGPPLAEVDKDASFISTFDFLVERSSAGADEEGGDNDEAGDDHDEHDHDEDGHDEGDGDEGDGDEDDDEDDGDDPQTCSETCGI